MMLRYRWISLIGVCSLIGAATGSAAPRAMPQSSAVPGGVALLDLPVVPGHESADASAPDVSFEGQKVMVIRREKGWTAVVGIPLARSPGPAAVEIHAGKTVLRRGFTVNGKQYVAVATGRSLVANTELALTPELKPGSTVQVYVFALP